MLSGVLSVQVWLVGQDAHVDKQFLNMAYYKIYDR